MPVGDDLPTLRGYPFEVRYSRGAKERARAAADVAADAYVYFRRLFSRVAPDIAIIVAGPTDWSGQGPYGLPFFRDDPAEIRPGIILMPADGGDFWVDIVRDIRSASPRGYARLRATYPDGAGGVDLQPFFDLITIHELGHAFEVLGDLRLPTTWLSEIFVNLAMHSFVATQRPESLPTLEVLPTIGAGSRKLAARMRADGYASLDDVHAHYTGGSEPMDALNYVWYQHRWLRLVAKMYAADGEDGLVRFWEAFHATDRLSLGAPTQAALARRLGTDVSPILGRAVRDWH